MDDIKYYVYALLDPTEDNRIFYIGKGTGERPKGHFFESLKNFAYTEIIGHNTENIFEKLLEDGTKISPNSKIKKDR
ncbi:MAG: hypothetical protein QG557_745, partial [Pseudomonadota bacterium]|nr:hypothetical protein [Pseudomonadota bacterium]